MRYVALGDSISIDLYTQVEGGGAASQLSRLLGARDFENRTFDGATTVGVLERDFASGAPRNADVLTLTIGGNDLLGGAYARSLGDRAAGQVALRTLVGNIDRLGELIAPLASKVVFNAVYDPTDGDDSRAADLGLTPEIRPLLALVNTHLRAVAERHGFLFCDLEALFHGHGFWSKDPWIVFHIEPNFVGATQIAAAWFALLAASRGP